MEGRRRGEGVIVPFNLRVLYEDFTAYKVENVKGSEECLEMLLDEESHMIRTDYIDEVSSITNTQLEKLLDREVRE